MVRFNLPAALPAALFLGMALHATHYADVSSACEQIQMRGVSASLDRAPLARKDANNRYLHGFLVWPQTEAPLSYGLFSAPWDQSNAPFEHTVSWRFPQGREMSTLEIDFGDGKPPVFSYAKHLMTVADSGCRGIAYYEISLKGEWESRLKNADSVKMKITGLAEAMPEAPDSEAVALTSSSL